MLMKALAGAGFALAFGMAPALADDVTVHLLHVNQTGDPFWKQVAEDYNESHPGVKVVVDYMENEAYKAKLPTLLQSDDRPDIIYSLGRRRHEGADRGRLHQGHQRRAGPTSRRRIYPAPLNAYVVDGKLYGIPMQLTDVSIIYNKDLLAKAGVDPASMETWDGFLDAVKKIKAAGITPLIMGGGDKWPMHFVWSYLLMRDRRRRRTDNRRDDRQTASSLSPFIEAGTKLKQLADLEPFQDGWLGTKYLPSQGMFGDGKGAMAIQLNGFIQGQQKNATDGKGIPDDNIGLALFPTLRRRQGQDHRRLRRRAGLPGDQGRAPRGGRLPEVLRNARRAEGGCGRRASTCRPSRAPTGSSTIRWSRRWPRRCRTPPGCRTSSTRISGRRSAASSTMSRSRSPPAT